MMAFLVWHQGGWNVVMASDNGVLTAIGVIMLLCSAVPWVVPVIAGRESQLAERATKVSGMLVEMIVFLRASNNGKNTGTDGWSEYLFADGDTTDETEKK